jgi:hypothetical protein
MIVIDLEAIARLLADGAAAALGSCQCVALVGRDAVRAPADRGS